jgi:serine/threonine protein kinase
VDSGTVLNSRFRVKGPLQAGSHGMTFLALDEESGEQVVIKRLHFQKMTDWKSDELFRREIAVLSQLSHPGIPKVVSAFVGSDSNIYLIQEHVDGVDLERLLEDGELWGDQKIRKVLIDILQVLEYLHRHSPPILHRDIKPANIVRNANGDYVLVDFGGVQVAASSMVGGTTVVGTFGYMPLEQLQGRASESTDLYALGMTLIRLASRMEPTDMEIIRGRVQFEPHVNLSSKVLGSLQWMIEPMAEDRPPNVEALLAGSNEMTVVDDQSLMKTDAETGLTLTGMTQTQAFMAGAGCAAVVILLCIMVILI